MKRRKLPWIPCIAGGFLVGTAIGYWQTRPMGQFVPQLVHGAEPKYHFIRKEDQHEVRMWELSEPIADCSRELSAELSPGDGWQPQQIRHLSPERIQFVRVHAPNGDFQFVRVTIEDEGNGHTMLTVDEEPKQKHAFKR